MLRRVAIAHRRLATVANTSRSSRIPRITRQEAMARRRDVSNEEMNELYLRVNSSHFGYEANRRRVVETKLLPGISQDSTGEDVASRFRTFVLTKDADNLGEYDRVMTQAFTSGVEPLTRCLMDPKISASLNKKPLTKESFVEFVRDSREYAADDNLCVAVEVNLSSATDDWEVAGVMIQFLEGYVAKNPEDRDVFGELNEGDRASWIMEGKAIPRGLDFTEKVLEKYPWCEHLGGTLGMFDTKKLLYGPDPITYQANVAYEFMIGVEPKYQRMGIGKLLFQATEAQYYAKGIDAAAGEFTSISRTLGRAFSWKKHKEVLYKDYEVWRYVTSDGMYDIPPDGNRYTQEELLSKGLSGEHKFAPWASIDWEGPPHYHKTNEVQYKPDPRYRGGWPSGSGGKEQAIPSVICGGVAAYKIFSSPLPVLYDESVLTSAARDGYYH